MWSLVELAGVDAQGQNARGGMGTPKRRRQPEVVSWQNVQGRNASPPVQQRNSWPPMRSFQPLSFTWKPEAKGTSRNHKQWDVSDTPSYHHHHHHHMTRCTTW